MALLAVPNVASSGAGQGAEGGAGDGGDPAGGERTLAVAHLERDPTRRERKVRATAGPAAGQRIWLRVPPGQPPLTVEVPSTIDSGSQLQLRIRVGGLVVQAKISPPLPPSCRADDPPLERQFGRVLHSSTSRLNVSTF